MVELKDLKNIYLYPDTVSFANGIPGLTNLIFTYFKETEILNCLFIFFGKDKKQIKMIEINEDGVWLYNKKLNNGNFILPKIEGKIKIDKQQLITILTTIKGKKIRNNMRNL